MKNSLTKGLMMFLTILCTSLTYSQQVTGTVSDSNGPLPGASVLVKGTTNERKLIQMVNSQSKLRLQMPF
jgi:iron complex outermembrane receptor protein